MIIVPIIALHHPQDQTIILSIRLQGKDLAGFYEFPGGKTEENELPIEALQREIFEELNLTIQQQDLKPVTFTEFRHKDQIFILLMYYTQKYSGIPIGKEGQEVQFVPIDALENYKMPPANTQIIPILKKYINDYFKN